MAFNASVNLGTVGNGITGQTVSISGCTGASCGSGCTSLATSQAVTSFPKTLTGIPDNVVSLFVKVDGGDCSGTTQCISITGIPGITPTPTTTSTTVNPTITPTTTTTPTTVDPTITPTTTTTTVNPTITPTTTITPSITYYGCGDTVSDTYTPSTFTTQIKYLDLSEAANGDTITISYTANDRPNRFNIYGDGFLVTSSLWAGSDPAMGTTYNGPWTGNPIDSDGTGTITFTYVAGTSYELRVDVGAANPDATPVPNPSDAWSVTISCASAPTITPTITSTPIYNFYRAAEVLQSDLANTYCSQIGYVTTGVLYSSVPYASISPGMTLYNDYGLTEPFTGNGIPYIVAISNTADVNTNSGTLGYIKVNSIGELIDVGTFSCQGGFSNQ
jgi:hypothetical protein